MPLIGLDFTAIPKEETEEIVYSAITDGYRRFQIVSGSSNEEQIGAAIKRSIAEDLVKREQLWISLIIDNNDASQEKIKEIIEKSLRHLGTTYVDIYYLNPAISNLVDILVTDDIVKNIGVQVDDLDLSKILGTTTSTTKPSSLLVDNTPSPQTQELIT